jgi:hypothetical protein
MIARVTDRFDLKPKRLAGDSAYGAAPHARLAGQGQGDRPAYTGVRQSWRDDGTLSRADFTFDAEHNVYVCPQGKVLRTTGRVHDGRTLLYR